MLGVNHAYVTAIGRLIGVVGLKELRWGIENANSGHLAKTAAAFAAMTAMHSGATIDTGKFDIILRSSAATRIKELMNLKSIALC